MNSDRSRVVLIAIAAALAGALVTATVTKAPAAIVGSYQVVIKNEVTGSTFPWAVRTWPDKDHCDAALGNLNGALRALVGDGPMPDVFSGNDPELYRSVAQAVDAIAANTGKIPNLSIMCVPAGVPS